MTENLFKNREERLAIRVELAKPNDWEACKKIRLHSITGPEAIVMGMTPERLQEEMNKTEEQWREETSSEEMFSVLSWDGSEPVGLGRAKKVEEGLWRVRNGYVNEKFRGIGIQPRMIALRLQEIIKRGGNKAVTGIRTDNPVSLHNVYKFGFKIVDVQDEVWATLESDLTDPEVIKKINEVLNAR